MERKTNRFWIVLSLSIILFSACTQDAVKEEAQDKELNKIKEEAQDKELNEKVKKLEVEIQKVIQEKNHFIILIDENRTLKQECEQLEQQKHELKLKCDKLMHENNDLEIENKKLKEENERLKRLISEPPIPPPVSPKPPSGNYNIDPNRQLEIKTRIKRQCEAMDKDISRYSGSWRSQIIGTMAPTLRSFQNMEERRYAHDLYKAHLESQKNFSSMYIFTDNCTKLIK